jgi:hypothetical protein
MSDHDCQAKLLYLREQRTRIWTAMRDLLTAAGNENRLLALHEIRRFDYLNCLLSRLDTKIAMLANGAREKRGIQLEVVMT